MLEEKDRSIKGWRELHDTYGMTDRQTDRLGMMIVVEKGGGKQLKCTKVSYYVFLIDPSRFGPSKYCVEKDNFPYKTEFGHEGRCI